MTYLNFIFVLSDFIINIHCFQDSKFCNAMFSDTLSLAFINNSVVTNVGVIKKGIAWTTDKDVKFENPDGFAENASLGWLSCV